MYYKDSPYDQGSYPQPQHNVQNVRAPLLPHGYDGSEMYAGVMENIQNYFKNPWVIVISVILIVIIIAWLMSGKENYRSY